jgi:magnesium chelatase family protein
MLVAAMNPCPCCYYGDPTHECTCSLGAIERYRKRISGPLMDRLDIHIQVPRVAYEKLTNTQSGEPSSAIRERVEAARERQRERFAATGLLSNADMGTKEVYKFCTLDAEGHALAMAATKQMGLSARGYHRILKLARTIADLACSQHIRPSHLAEALQYRQIQNV